MSIARHVYRIHIKAPIDRVFDALIDPDFTRRYFHGTAFDSPPRAGQPYRTSLPDGRGAVDGTIEVLEPPHRLVMTWHTLYDPEQGAEPPSRVEWTLTEAGPGLTQVDLVHGDLARSPLTWARVRDGWVWIIDGLKTLLETGDDLPAPTIETPTIDDAGGEWHRAQAIECNNATWEMIEAERTPANDEELLRRAYASAYHWQRATGRGPENEARALYMIAKAHLLAGHAEQSLQYAERCLEQCREHG
ncbi:MAG: SRPBCC family protein, partial [Ilumatobacteraceae bacterium]